jgi:hypothetical protein
MAAPGVAIISTYFVSTDPIPDYVAVSDGTSMAAPHVAGVAALLESCDPSLSGPDKFNILVANVCTAGSPNIGGILNAKLALDAAGCGAPPGCTGNPECDDGLACNGVETCDIPTGTCQPGTPVNCNDGVACTTDTCNEPSGTCSNTPNNGACSDGLFCNGSETCHATLGCQAGSAPNCDDGIACTADSCNEGTDSCDHAPNNALCDDGLFCNGAETCNATLGCQAGTDPCGGAACDEGTDTCAGGDKLWLCFLGTTTVPTLGSVADEDIVAYDLGNGTWSWIFDGSDVGLSALSIGGMSRLADGDILLSFVGPGSVPGLIGGPNGTNVDDSDIVRFTPTSLGATTAGTFNFYFDGSDVGLTANSEDIDAIGVLSDGRIIVSSSGNFSGTGASGVDADMFVFNATSLGSVTSGSFALHFDGSDVGLSTSSEDIDAGGVTSTGALLLSTSGAFTVTGVSGSDEDILQFTGTFGSITSGTYSMFLDLSTIGISTAADVTGVEIVAP